MGETGQQINQRQKTHINIQKCALEYIKLEHEINTFFVACFRASLLSLFIFIFLFLDCVFCPFRRDARFSIFRRFSMCRVCVCTCFIWFCVKYVCNKYIICLPAEINLVENQWALCPSALECSGSNSGTKTGRSNTSDSLICV